MTLKEKLQHVMEQAVETCEVAGVNLLIEQDGEELCYCQAGMADIEENRPMTRDAIFRLYSQTKPITAAAAMILMERGKLDLRQPVSDFLPAFTAQFPTPIRVFDLLRMTSGLLYPNDTSEAGRQSAAVFEEMDRRLYTEQAMTTQEAANALAGCALAFEPGSSWEYGTSADVLGAVIEVVSGMKFGEFLDKEIFQPLGMKDTAFWVSEEKQNRLAAAYETIIGSEKNALLRYDGNNLAIRNKMDQPPAFESGGAGLASTLDDYMRFAKMLLQEGTLDGTQILKPATVRYLTSGELMDNQQTAFDRWFGLEGFSYGNLMRVCKNPDRTGYLARKGEYGWDGWLGPYFANFPNEKLTMLMGTQKKDGGTFALTVKLRNVLLSELL
ncbi:MAG: beta-lactamase family protein [bacterium]|nr:beta-lactamase family protein [bacterium]MCM1424143.1 beta-lactamase family protein [bacterium]